MSKESKENQAKKGKGRERDERVEIADGMIEQLIERYGLTPEGIFGEEGLVKALTRRVVEKALAGELTYHLGYAKGEAPADTGGNHRNGSTSKGLATDSGMMEIEVPRDREGSFEPVLVRKRQRRLSGLDEKILGLYARGMTMREIQGFLEEQYGTEVSPELISTVTESVSHTNFQQVRVECALTRYRDRHAEYPTSLGDLMPDFLDRVPTDVMDGQPLRYRRSETGGYLALVHRQEPGR